ncbi:hypothetical protein FN846DRAFT_930998 [Sphaerosporella brunnea]|uniref:Uncharacterized protein n=1 Tax=Sphaerosporella brunnea TaxID=1250544 RepID=A0A5J5F8H5_9PEZI|nr:hypothetical protein FN846DRAFT_930998 [Sphaerosporella brunnea]
MPRNNTRRSATMAEKPSPMPYKPIATEFLGQQKIPLDVAFWRCNLVVASKHHNYLFIAARSDINVYKPIYPHQTLSEEPYAVLTSEQLTPSRGYIDQRNPHAINSLTVGELGTEEVLVSAHDDGDVCVRYTRDVKRIALRYNVGLSAWGVALHKEKRLLAVSSNTHKITVFDLAVGRKDKTAEDDWERDERTSEDAKGRKMEKPIASGSVPRHRTSMKRPCESDDGFDKRIPAGSRKSRKRRKDQPAIKDQGIKILEGHNDNIPNISFLPDASGRWLAGTSIDGMVVLWDVHTQRMVERCKFGFML